MESDGPFQITPGSLKRPGALRQIQWHMRSIFRQIHLYGGLFCSPYLLVFGLSSIDFNHRFSVLSGNAEVRRSQRTVVGPVFNEPVVGALTKDVREARRKDYAGNVRDQLGLFGHVLPWETWIEDDGEFRTVIHRPGREYEIRVNRGVATVKETRNSGFRALLGLHGFEGLPKAPFVSTWKWYTELTVWFVLFMVGSGVFLWTFRKNERRVGLATLAGAGSLTAAWFLYILVVG
jgi:hypothetical protein